jgi:hypothetical protein
MIASELIVDVTVASRKRIVAPVQPAPQCISAVAEPLTHSDAITAKHETMPSIISTSDLRRTL